MNLSYDKKSQCWLTVLNVNRILFLIHLSIILFFRTQSNLTNEQEYLSEESEMEENVLSPPEPEQEIQVSDDIEATEQRLDAIILCRKKKKQRTQTDTPSQ